MRKVSAKVGEGQWGRGTEIMVVVSGQLVRLYGTVEWWKGDTVVLVSFYGGTGTAVLSFYSSAGFFIGLNYINYRLSWAESPRSKVWGNRKSERAAGADTGLGPVLS